MLSYWLLILLSLVFTALILLQIGSLPDPVASNFDLQGNINGYMAKGKFIILMVGLNLGTPLFFFLMARLLYILPSSCLNIPNRDYWLQPALRESTLRDNELFLVYIANGTTLFMGALSLMICYSGAREQGIHPILLAGLIGVFLLFVTALAARSILKYNKVPDSL